MDKGPKPEVIWTKYDSNMHSYGGHLGYYDKFDNGGHSWVSKEEYDKMVKLCGKLLRPAKLQ